jgi:preprotein translocase SecE subunit
MAVGIYKQGQGYWVRVLTAAFAGGLVLAGAAWAYRQAESIRLPTPTQRLSLSAVRGEAPASGAVVRFSRVTGSEVVPTGSAAVSSFTPESAGGAVLVVESVTLGDLEGTLVGSGWVVSGPDQSPTPLRAEVVSSVAVPIFDPIYLQAGLAGAILLMGSAVVYYVVGMRRSAVDFLIATDGEMKKVNWSTRREVRGSTVVVVVACVLLALFIFTFDYGFGTFFRLIGVLQ